MAIEMFLKLDGIDGESTDAKHKNEIEILSYHWGVSQQGSPTGAASSRAAGRAAFDELRLAAHMQKSSPKLFLACASGKQIKTGVLTVRKPGPKKFEFLKLSFEGLIVSSFEQGAHEDEVGGVPLEEIGLRFGKIRIDYTQHSATGAAGGVTEAEWDLKTGR